jgi:hypothetical protein
MTGEGSERSRNEKVKKTARIGPSARRGWPALAARRVTVAVDFAFRSLVFRPGRLASRRSTAAPTTRPAAVRARGDALLLASLVFCSSIWDGHVRWFVLTRSNVGIITRDQQVYRPRVIQFGKVTRW